jgi:hypothetical protein
MFKLVRTVTFAVALGVVISAAAAEGSAMDQKLSAPAAVPLDFLRWIKRDANWLRQSLAAQGAGSDWTTSDGVLEVTTVAALRRANRIRTFAHLAAPGLRPPYFDLPVRRADGQLVRCVTLFPRSVAPQIGPLDFDRDSFPAAEADPTILAMCRVEPAAEADYVKLDRDAFRARYFDGRGDLKIEFAELNTNAAFIARAIDHGFFVMQQDLTGRLRLSPE